MKVFISWSGEPSRGIAAALRHWLPLVIQHARPWMSDEEIGSGMRWNDQVAKALDETDFGIVCLTRSNQHQPWLIFESGALAKRLEVGRIVPLCIDMASAEITGPLEAFQGRSFDKNGMRKLVHDLSAARDEPLASEQVDTLYDALWPQLQKKVDDVKSQAPRIGVVRRSDPDMLEELVERVRRIERRASPARLPGLSPQIEMLSGMLSGVPRVYLGGRFHLPDHVRVAIGEIMNSLPEGRLEGWDYRDRELMIQLSQEELTIEEDEIIRDVARNRNIDLRGIAAGDP